MAASGFTIVMVLFVSCQCLELGSKQLLVEANPPLTCGAGGGGRAPAACTVGHFPTALEVPSGGSSLHLVQ